MTDSIAEKNLPAFILKRGKDYVPWASQMKSWFYEQNLWQYIIGYVEPIEEPDYQTSAKTEVKKYLDWQIQNSKAKNMMCNRLDINYRILIQDCVNCTECWDTLKNYFLNDSIIQQQQIEEEFESFHLNYSKSMEYNIMEFNFIISRLKHADMEPTEQKKCYKLIQSLPKSYAPLKTMIKYTTSKSNPLKLRDLIERIEDISREKRHWNNPIKKYEDVNNVVTQNNQTRNSKFNNKNFKTNNTNNTAKYNTSKSKKIKCTFCDGDHFWTKCPHKEQLLDMGKKLNQKSKKEYHENTNLVKTEETNSSPDNFILTIQEDYQENKYEDYIIIDTGSTISASPNIDLFKDLNKVEDFELRQFVNTDETSVINCRYQGTLCLPIINNNNQKLTLTIKNALFEPRAEHSILSISQLTSQLKYNCQFNEQNVIFTKPNQKPIQGIRKGKLYIIPLSNKIKLTEYVNNTTISTNKTQIIKNNISPNDIKTTINNKKELTLNQKRNNQETTKPKITSEHTKNKNSITNNEVKRRYTKKDDINTKKPSINTSKMFYKSSKSNNKHYINNTRTNYLKQPDNKEETLIQYKDDPLTLELINYHYKFGHVSFYTLKKMALLKLIPYKLKNATIPKYCKVCHKGKQTRNVIPKESTNNLLDLLVMSKRDIHGNKYVLGIMDEYSSLDHAYFLKKKSQASRSIKNHIRMIERKFQKQVVYLRADRGGEFISKSIQTWIRNKGISLELTAPYSSFQNGQRERSWRTLCDMTRCLLYQTNLPTNLWSYAFQYSIYIRNRIVGSTRNIKSPMEKVYNIVPDLSQIQVFGSTCSVKNLHAKKLDVRSNEYTFIGVNHVSKAYDIYDPVNKKVLVRRDIQFNKNITPLLHSKLNEHNFSGKKFINSDNKHRMDEIKYPDTDSDSTESVESVIDETSDDELNEKSIESNKNITNISNDTTYSPVIPTDESSSINQDLSIQNTQIRENDINTNQPLSLSDHINYDKNTDIHIRRSTRESKPPPRYYNEYIYYLNPSNNLNQTLYENNILKLPVPKSYLQAMKTIYHEQWYIAMKDEIESLEKNKTWILIKPPPNAVIIGNMWVFKIKQTITGKIERFKARLVARGDRQIKGVNYDETQAPVIKFTTIMILLIIATKLKLIIKTIDINTAYLYATLNEEIYMHLPNGFYEDKKKNGYKAKLLKSIYGLKQSALLWYQTLSSAIKTLGYEQLYFDHCVFIKYTNELVIVGIYVDDILIISSNEDEIIKFKENIRKHFDFKDSIDFESIIGIKVTKDKKGNSYLIQDQYIKDILSRYQMNECNGCKTPMEYKINIFNEINDEKEKILPALPFQECIGSLLYLLTRTRPDISFSVSILAQVQLKPSKSHFLCIKRIFRYLKQTINLGIKIDKSQEIRLSGFVDASFAINPGERKSITGYIFFIDETPICWKTRKQQIVAKSTMESELIALESAICELLWIMRLLNELSFKQNSIILYCDNQATIRFVKNKFIQSRNKHIDIQRCFSRQFIENEFIDLRHISTNNMKADGLTKSLGPNKFNIFLSQINMDFIAEEC